MTVTTFNDGWPEEVNLPDGTILDPETYPELLVYPPPEVEKDEFILSQVPRMEPNEIVKGGN